MNTRVLIAGGYGLVGTHIARQIRKISRDVEIFLAGRHPQQGKALAEELGNTRVVPLNLDEPRPLFRCLDDVDAIVAALNDPRDALFHAALERGISHIGITKTADDIAPLLVAVRHKSPRRPIVVAGHWQAGVLTLGVSKTVQDFAQVETVEMTALYDPLDPIGPMAAKDAESFVHRGLLRRDGIWSWVESRPHARRVALFDDRSILALPMGVLDVPSVATMTSAPNVRFDIGSGESLGTSQGRAASHELIIDIEGVLLTGKHARQRTMISDPSGQAHLTALGVTVALERVLGLDGMPPPNGALYFPETLVTPNSAVTRFTELGVQIMTTVHFHQQPTTSEQ